MSIWKERLQVFFQYKDLLFQLVQRDVKLKYRRSFLGYVWSVLNPLLIMLVMTVVFSTMFQRKITNYPVYLITGRTLFEFYSTSNKGGHAVDPGNGTLLKKPMCRNTFSRWPSDEFSGGLLLLPGGHAHCYRVHPRQGQLVPAAFSHYSGTDLYFQLGAGFFLSAINVFFRDMQHIYQAVITAWMYATPLFYDLDSIKNTTVVFIIKAFNPLYYYVAGFRDLVYYGRFPGPRIFWGGWIIAFLALGIGLFYFKKVQDKFILYI